MIKFQEHSFKVVDNLTLNQVLRLNESHYPHLSSLNNLDVLKELIAMSSYNSFLEIDGEIIGFIICMREGRAHKSPNYQYFKKKHKQFLYIDRVGVKQDFLNMGLGAYMYNKLIHSDDSKEVILCAEVNTKPENLPSINFHKKIGFKLVEKKQLNIINEVAYFELIN